MIPSHQRFETRCCQQTRASDVAVARWRGDLGLECEV
jgi:hypothetical protein